MTRLRNCAVCHKLINYVMVLYFCHWRATDVLLTCYWRETDVITAYIGPILANTARYWPTRIAQFTWRQVNKTILEKFETKQKRGP